MPDKVDDLINRLLKANVDDVIDRLLGDRKGPTKEYYYRYPLKTKPGLEFAKEREHPELGYGGAITAAPEGAKVLPPEAVETRLPNIIERGELPPRDSWKGMGGRGMGEVLSEKQWERLVPVLGSGFEIADMAEVQGAGQYLSEYKSYKAGELRFPMQWGTKEYGFDEKTSPELEAAKARRVIEDFILKTDYMETRGRTWPAAIVEGIVDILPWIAEFAMTGGISAGVKASAKKLLIRFGKDTLKHKLASGALAMARPFVSGGVRTTLIGGPKILAQTQRRLMDSYSLDENDNIVIQKNDKDAVEALIKSIANVATQYATEEMGGAVDKGLGKVLKWIGGKGEGIRARFLGALAKSLDKPTAGWAEIARFPGEYAEERFANVFEGLGGFDEAGLTDTEMNALERAWELIPKGEDFFIEMGVLLGAQSVGLAGTGVQKARLEAARAKVRAVEEAAKEAFAEKEMPTDAQMEYMEELKESRDVLNERLAEKAAKPAPKDRHEAEVIAKETLRATYKADADEALGEIKAKPAKYDVEATDVRTRRAAELPERLLLGAQLNPESVVEKLGKGLKKFYDIVWVKPLLAKAKAFELQADAIDRYKRDLIGKGIDVKELEKWSYERYGSKAQKMEIKLQNYNKPLELYVEEWVRIMRKFLDPWQAQQLLAEDAEGINLERDKSRKPIKLTMADALNFWRNATTEMKEVAKLQHRLLNDLSVPVNAESLSTARATFGDLYMFSKSWDEIVRNPSRISPEEFEAEQRRAERGEPDLSDMGIWKERKGSTAAIMVGESSSQFARVMAQKASFAAKSLVYERALQLLKNRDFRDAVIERHRKGAQLLKDMEDALIHDRGMVRKASHPIHKAIQWFIPKAHRALLGAKFWIPGYQSVSYILPLANADIPAKYLMMAMPHLAVGDANMRSILSSNNAVLRARYEGSGYGLITPVETPMQTNSIYGPMTPRLSRGMTAKNVGAALDWIAFSPIKWRDNVTIDALGKAVYLWGRDKGLTGKALDKWTADKTEAIVRRTQPTWDPMTLSALARAGRYDAAAHLAVMFSSQRNKNFNILYQAWNDFTSKKDRTYLDYAKLARSITVVTLQNAMIYWIWYLSFRGIGAKEEEEWGDLAIGSLKRVFGNWLIVGDWVSDIISMVLEERQMGPRGTPLSQAMKDTGLAIGSAAKWVEYASKEGGKNRKKADAAMKRALRYTLKGPTVFAGFPGQGIEASTRRLIKQEKKRRSR